MTALTLPASLDTAAAAPLRLDLLARLDAGEPMVLDASGVARVGQACLQVLVSARTGAAQAGLAFAVADPSEAFADMVTLAGLDVLFEPVG